MELMKLLLESGQPTKYGLILAGVDGDIDYSQFEDTEVYTNKDEFWKRLAELFAKAEDDLSLEELSKKQLLKHKNWDDFCEACWIVDKF